MIFTAAGETYSISLRSYEVTKIMLACGGTYVLLYPSLSDGPAAARPAFGACRHPIVTIAHPLLIRKPVRRFWRQTKKERTKAGRHGRLR